MLEPTSSTTVDFIHSLVKETREGEILWERWPNTLTGTARNYVLQFITSGKCGREEAWRFFGICDEQGNEVFQVTDVSAANGIFPFAPAVDTLFFAAVEVSREH